MACTAQEIVNAAGCFNGCLTEQQSDAALTVLTCIASGGVAPGDIFVIGGEGDDIIIGGEGGGMIGVE